MPVFLRKYVPSKVRLLQCYVVLLTLFVAKYHLTPTATSFDIERLFSTERNPILPENAEMIYSVGKISHF